MFARLKRRMRLRPYSTTARLFFAAILTVIAVGRVADEINLMVFTSQLDTLRAPVSGETLTTVEWHFEFQRGVCSVSVDVPRESFERAAAIPTSEIFSSRGSVRDRYVGRLVDALAHDEVVARVIDDLRDTRDRLGLDSDEYLELMVHAVQAIPYGVVDRDIELPAELLVAGRGVCTETSLLLGAMLVHEGYETVMWAFDSQHHIALGVAGNGALFRGSRYTFIETTATRYVGQVEPKYNGYAAYVPPPAVIELGGTRAYLAGHETDFLLRVLQAAEKDSALGERLASRAARSVGSWREEYARRAEEHLSASRIARFINENVHDRPGAYAALVYETPVVLTR